jgi:dTDP-D-glucose 4,6-dehydratase
VYGEWPEQYATEGGGLGEPVNPYDHTKQTIDNITNTMYKHNIKMKSGIGKLLQCEKIFGLRFGTVNGYSENFRSDVMINAMWNSAKTYGQVKVYNGDTRRSILGITDLCRAIHTIIEKGRNPKVYNLASFHSTSLEIGKTVANLMDVPCVEAEMKVYGGNEKMTTKNYDFWVSTDQFCTDFDFTFTDSIGSIVEDINFNMAENKLKGIRTISKPRDKHIPYGY